MKTDTLLYRVFKELPRTLFELIGRPAADAERYVFDAIELKDTSVRLDGIFRPQEPGDLVYFVESQFYRNDNTYSNLLLKIALYLDKVDAKQDWQAVVAYRTRSLEQEELRRYRALLQSDQLIRVYLDELPNAEPGQLGLQIMELIVAKDADAVVKAKALIPTIRAANLPDEARRRAVELIETTFLYKFPGWSRKELEKMLEVNDIRETRIFQEALEEGIEKGIEKGKEEGRLEGIELGAKATKEDIVLAMLADDMPLEAIARVTRLSLAEVKQIKKGRTTK